MTERTLTREQEQNGNSASCVKEACPCTVLPKADIVESRDSVVLFVELPGVQAADLEVAVENGILDVTGTAERRLPEGFQPVSWGNSSRRYVRQFKLAESLDTTQMQAVFTNGLLKLVVPKKLETRRQQIPIATSA